MEGKKLNLLGYVRVSTTLQVEGTSLEFQEKMIKKYCEDKGYKLVHIFVDGGVSSFKDRPQFNNMMKRLQDDSAIDGVIVYCLSRLGRSVGDLHHTVIDFFDKKGKIFISTKENIDLSTKEGRLMFNMLSSICEYERDLITERMTEGRNIARIKGSKSGKPCHRPEKEINWGVVDGYRRKGLSWGLIAEILSENENTKIHKNTLIRRARKRGMKME